MTAEEVQKMEIGRTVVMSGKGKDGQQTNVQCTVAGLPGRKFLTFRDGGKIKRCAIRDYPGVTYQLR